MKVVSIPSLMAIAIASALSACGPSDQPATPPVVTPVAPISAVFLDGAVEGLDVVAGDRARTSTDANGGFSCVIGTKVAFSIGALALGNADCAPILTPMSLAGVSDIKDNRVINRLLALQLFDDDNDPSNGIRIVGAVKTAMQGKSLDFSAAPAAFDLALAAHLAAAGPGYGARSINADRRMLVREHFEDTMSTKLANTVTETFTLATPLRSVSATVTRYQIVAPSTAFVPYEGSNAAVKADFPNGFLPSYGSGLAFKGTNASGELEFYGLTDRGPNGDGPTVPALSGTGVMGSKLFPSPSFTPSIGVLTVSAKGAVLGATMPIKISASVNSSGLPVPAGSIGNSAEVPVFDSMRFDAQSKAVFNAGGVDSEAIVFDKKRNALWVSDEYGPFLLMIDAATGVIKQKYAPGSGLPAILAKRRANRGMEGMTLDVATDKIHAFLQSPLSDGSALYAVTAKSEQVERFARFTRWIEFDPVTGLTTHQYAYPIASADYADGRTGNAKLGDMVALGNGKFIVIEQGAGPDGKVANKLMLVEIGAATDIGAAAYNATTSDLEKSSMSGTAVNGSNWATVLPLKKTLLLDLNAIGWLAEKAEGLALVDGSTLALTNDNDFGLITKVMTPAGTQVADADVTKCNVDAAGAIVSSTTAGCSNANTIRVGRGQDKERPGRLWLIKFGKPLGTY